MTKYWQANMIAENDPGSGVYLAGRTDRERDAMARKIYDPSSAIADEIIRECTPYVPTFDNVMIDIETMSLNKHKALILSVGMLEFDPRDPKKLHLGKQDIAVLDVYEQLLLGRHVSLGTQEFWIKEHKKDPRSSAHWMAPVEDRISAAASLARVRNFCRNTSSVWANGTQFDLSNLEGLAEDIRDGDPLWHYQSPRDMRTFMKTTRNERTVAIGDALDIPGCAHDPVYDCISQAYRVWGNWRD